MRGATTSRPIASCHEGVSIHAPRAGCDSNSISCSTFVPVSIHAPRAGCDIFITWYNLLAQVSIHAPRAGCDMIGILNLRSFEKFQFTHPVRGATYVCDISDVSCRVSIHAPRAGCDCSSCCAFSSFSSFNSRTPCGVRHRCPKVRINRRLDDDPLRTEDYKRVCRCVGGDCEAVCACISTCANSLPFL